MIRQHASSLVAIFVTLSAACSSDAPASKANASQPSPGTSAEAPGATITKSSGGKLTASDGKANLSVPTGAVADDVKITVDVLAQSQTTASAVYQFAPEGTAFALAATVQISSTGISVPTGKKLDFARLDGEKWVSIDHTTSASGMLEARLTKLATVALVFVDAEANACSDECMAQSGAVCCTTCGCQGNVRCTPTCATGFKWDCEMTCCFDYKTLKCE